MCKENIFDLLVVKDNIHILCIRAKTLYQNYQIPAAYDLCLKAIKKDPLCFEILPVYTLYLDLFFARAGDKHWVGVLNQRLGLVEGSRALSA